MTMPYASLGDAGDNEEDNYAPGVGILDSEQQANVRSLLDDAVLFVQSDISPLRETATNYYFGRPFGNEEEGRSQVVETTLRDTVLGIMPSLLRVFFGPDQVCEFMPTLGSDPKQAQIATGWVNNIIRDQNPGFMVFQSWFKDALYQKMGVVKAWVEDKLTHKDYIWESITPDAAALIAQDKAFIIESSEVNPDGTLSLKGTRSRITQHIKIDSVPPEEFVFSRNARTLEDAIIVAHRRVLRVSELVEMGYDFDEVAQYAGDTDPNWTIGEVIARSVAQSSVGWGLDVAGLDMANRPVLYTEAYPYLDLEQTGRAELYKLCLVGSGYVCLKKERVNERPFAILHCDPVPHTLVGQDIGDLTMDLQRINSNILRGTLDSLNMTLNPRTEAVLGQVNMADLMNPEIGGIVRVEAPGMLRELASTFVGREALGVMERMDAVGENRTGRTRAAQGLDADALQSSTKLAVSATMSASQQRAEMISRTFAETGMKALMTLVLRLAIQYQDQTENMMLFGAPVTVDPRLWDLDWQLNVKVALGGGQKEEKLNTLAAIIAKQENLIQTLGPANPLTNVQLYYNALDLFVRTASAGVWGVDLFFTNPQTVKLPPPEPPKPAPEELLAQMQMKQIEADIAMKQADLELKREEMNRKYALEEFKVTSDAELKRYEIELEYNGTVNEMALKGAIAHDQNEIAAREAATSVATA